MTDSQSPNRNEEIEDEIHELRTKVETREEFSKLLTLLQEDYAANSDEWENPSLDMYLEAMSAWLADSEKYYAGRGVNVDPDKPSWRVLADILLAARVYE